MELSIVRYTGEDTGRKVSLPEAVFAVVPKDHAIYLDVKHILANRRQGTHKSKEKGEITGSTRKLRKQKGTGGARVGSIKSPIFKGGGRVFGPRPRDYGFKLNKKVKQLARRSALSYKAQTNNITVLEDFSLEVPKTSTYVCMLQKLSLDRVKTLLVLGERNANIILSGRNLQNTKVVTAPFLNTYDILHADQVLFSESAMAWITENLQAS